MHDITEYNNLFQSTLPHGSDQIRDKSIEYRDKISIHAPLRERQGIRYKPANCLYFNPRSLAGATATNKSSSSRSKFQSTLPCGSDILCFGWFPRDVRFQSTLPCGSDSKGRPVKIQNVNFNPRSLAGATQTLNRHKPNAGFQSTLPCGSDAYLYSAYRS